MNYKKIVIEGIYNTTTEKECFEYFTEKYNNAKSKNYKVDTFFDNCLDVVAHVNSFLNSTNEQREYFKGNEYLSIQNPLYEDWMDALTIDQVFSASLTTKMNWEKIINEVRNQHEPKKESELSPINFELHANEIVYLFDILIQAGFIKEPLKTKKEGSYYKKMETYFTSKNNKMKNLEQVRSKNINTKPPSNSEGLKQALIDSINKMY